MIKCIENKEICCIPVVTTAIYGLTVEEDGENVVVGTTGRIEKPEELAGEMEMV